MDYNQKDGYPPTAPGPGYPPYPPGPHGDMPYPYPQPQQPPPGYSYPPTPVPVAPERQPILQQPTSGFYPLIPPEGYPPYAGGGYPQPPQDFGGGGGYGPPQGYPQPPMQMQPQGYPQPSMQMQPQGYSSGQTVPLNVPPGLEYLTQVDRLYVKQKVELLEAFLGCETKNKYKIKDSNGQDLYTAKEDTGCCTRNCCGSMRPFDLKIKDGSDREVIHLSRPLACNSCLCPCWLQSIEVFSPPGQLCGTVEQEWSILSPKFLVKDAAGGTVLRIEGPFCTYSICGNVEFQILSRDGATQVGKISKKWSGLIREAFTDADNFGINFPVDLDVKMKAVMLGACFLIDFMFFEKSQNQENDGLGML